MMPSSLPSRFFDGGVGFPIAPNYALAGAAFQLAEGLISV